MSKREKRSNSHQCSHASRYCRIIRSNSTTEGGGRLRLDNDPRALEGSLPPKPLNEALKSADTVIELTTTFIFHSKARFMPVKQESDGSVHLR
jgi:hypothetical protein